MSGVGLKFTGYPTDVEQFKWILAKEGCHPDAADRILNRIENAGFDCLTVMNRLAFDWVRDNLALLGVTMTFIPPQEDWTQKYKNGEWTKELMDKVFSTPKNKDQYLDGHEAYKE